MKPIQVSGGTPGILDSILRLEKACFPDAWQYPDAVTLFSEALHDTSNISIALYHDEEVVGYALAYPMTSVIRELKRHDPEIAAIDNAMYLETIAVYPTFQRQGGGRLLLKAVFDAVGLHRRTRLAIHARCCNEFSNSLKRQYADYVEVSRHLPHWFYGGNEPYDFIVISLPSEECSPIVTDQFALKLDSKHL